MRTRKKRSWDTGARTFAPEDIVTGGCEKDVRSRQDCWRPGDGCEGREHGQLGCLESMLSLLVELVERTSSKRFVPSSVRGSHTSAIDFPAAATTPTANIPCPSHLHSVFCVSPDSGFWISCTRIQLLRSAGLSHHFGNTETTQTIHRLITRNTHVTRNHVVFVLVPRSPQAGDPG